MTDAEIFTECRQLSIMGIKLHALIKAGRTCADVPGSVCEVGVYRGGSGLALCRCFPQKWVYLIDTFSGIPENDAHPQGHQKGDFADTSVQAVRDMLTAHGVDRALLLRGDVRNMARDAMHTKLAFIHLDCDIEQSTRAACDLLLPRLSPQGGIFFDDYGSSNRCPGVKIVVDELMASGRFEITVETGTAFLKLIA